MGNSPWSFWLKALLPFSSWPQFVPYVEIPFTQSLQNRYFISLAGPITSFLLAIACTNIALAFINFEFFKIIALAAWAITLGGIASDVFGYTSIDETFRCGNFGMLVICAMDR